MHIYIDESGTFSGIGQTNRPSVVGALVIPNTVASLLFSSYNHLRKHLPKDRGEVKGRQLSETHIAAVIDFLRNFPVIFEATCIDVGLHTENGVELHRDGQAEGIIANIEAARHQTLKNDLLDLKRNLESFPLQLYIQSVANFELVYRVVNNASLYYVQRAPEELGSFEWIVDAKDQADPITPWEKWWSLVVRAMTQSKSAREPFMMLKGADYSHFKRYETDWAGWAFPEVPPPLDGKAINVKLIMSEKFRFSDQAEPGLELVDILTNALKRALAGNLGRGGWNRLPEIMIHRPTQYFQMISLQGIKPRRLPYGSVVAAFRQGGRLMILQ